MFSELRKALLITTLLFFIFDFAQAQITNPNEQLGSVHSDEIWPQTLNGNFFNEFWNYQFYFDNGMKVHVTFSVADFGTLKAPVSGVRLSVFDTNGDVHQLSREYDLNLLLQDKENHRLQLNPNRELYFEGKLPDEHRVIINTIKDGVTYDIALSLRNIKPSIKFGNGEFMVHNETVGIITHIPYARVRGHVAVAGDRHEVSGTGYMDHTFQNQTTTKLMDSGFRFVNHTDSENWDLLYFMSPQKNNSHHTIGYRLLSEEGNVSVKGINKINNIHIGRAFDTEIPRIIELQLTNESTVRVSRTKDQEKFSILSELGWVARRAAKSFLGGEVIDFRGEATLQETSHRPKEGNYSFFLVD